MAEIRPFRGIHYNEKAVGDLASVICPPYDVISPDGARELYNHSQYNFIRLEYGRLLPADADPEERHNKSAALMEQWLGQAILTEDEKPAIYLHDHSFINQGRKYRRRGIVVAVRLESWDKKVVRPHEATMAKPKSDRLNLLWQLRANTSPILGLYADQDQQIASRLASAAEKPPVLSLSSATEGEHQIWAINEPEIIHSIQASLADQPLYIADGHHRYESALTYQRERQTCVGETSGDEGYNYVMMSLVELADPGLVILPPHRLLRGLSQTTLNELSDKLKLVFNVTELPLNETDVWQRADDFLAGEEAERVRFVLYGLAPERLLLLTLRDLKAARQMIPYFHGDLYSSLNVSILDHVVQEEIMGLTGDSHQASFAFSKDRRDAVARVDNQEYQIAFLLNPIKAAAIKAIADGGDRMPRKSTYFYPKPPSGLVFRRLD